METTLLQNDALALAEKNMLQYFQTHEVKYVAEDAVFRNLETGECYHGRAEIGAMLHYMYQVAFDARAEMRSYIITADKAQVEGLFTGKHIGEFAGIPATNKEVKVPLCVTYDLKDGLIREARIYMLADVLMRQLGVTMGSSRQRTTYLVRDIFYLKFGQYRAAKILLDKALEQGLMEGAQQVRAFTDFTGDAYRLILEEGFDSLNDYETYMQSGFKKEEWQTWYELFKPLVERSHREILKQVM